jgi:succinate dehydrogenase hydrophobic anchor subunit
MKPYCDCNGDPLVIGHLYHLVTYHNGEYKKEPEHWAKTIWNGTTLIDLDGCSWTEWLGHDRASQEDIRPIN